MNKSLIRDKKIIVLCSEQRHGSTTFCDHLSKMPNNLCTYEAFNNNGTFFNCDINLPLEPQLNKIISKQKHILNSSIISFKLFRKQKHILKLLSDENLISKGFILTRNLEDSYKSLVKSLSSGNWATNPEIRNKGLGSTGYKIEKSKIIKKELYTQQVNQWYDFCKAIFSENNIPYNVVGFDDIIKKSFDVYKYINDKPQT